MGLLGTMATEINPDNLWMCFDQGTGGPPVRSGYASMELWHQLGTQKILNRLQEC